MGYDFGRVEEVPAFVFGLSQKEVEAGIVLDVERVLTIEPLRPYD